MMKAFVKHIILLLLIIIIAIQKSFAQCTKKYDNILHKAIYIKADVMPEFPGGLDAWRRYIERNLTIPDSSIDDCSGQWSLKSSFIVHTDGSLSNIIINNKTDTLLFCGVEKSFFKLLKNSPVWIPGKCGKNIVPV